MLVPAMNHEEIAAQIKSEFQKICDTTHVRLFAEYDRERRKLKISKEASYPKEYEIRTAGKNNWIIFLHKAPGEKKYTGTKDLSVTSVVYYYSKKGLMVFSPLIDNPTLSGYTSHFFKRYNERLCLNLHNPIDIVRAFFRKGVYCSIKLVERNNKPYLIAFGVDGIRFGKILHGFTYVEWKTFVPRELAYSKQKEWENELNEKLLRELKESENEDTYNPYLLRGARNTIGSLPIGVRKIA